MRVAKILQARLLTHGQPPSACIARLDTLADLDDSRHNWFVRVFDIPLLGTSGRSRLCPAALSPLHVLRIALGALGEQVLVADVLQGDSPDLRVRPLDNGLDHHALADVIAGQCGAAFR